MRGSWRLLIAAAILAALIVWLRWPSKKTSADLSSSAAPPLVKFDTGQASRIEIRQPQKPTVILDKEGSDWKLVQPYTATADQNAVSSLLSDLSAVSPTQTIGATSDAASFGLNQPSEVEVDVSKGSKYTFQFGSDAPTGGSTYMKMASSPTVVAVPSYIKNDAVKTAFDLQDKAPVHFNADKLSALKVTYHGQTRTFERKNGNWPDPAKDSIQTLLDALQTSQMGEVIDAAGKAAGKYGVSHPQAVIVLTSGNQSSTVEIGNKKAPSDTYARSSNSPIIFTLSDSILRNAEAVMKSPKKVVSSTPTNPPVKP